jgi:hypothetical protein
MSVFIHLDVAVVFKGLVRDRVRAITRELLSETWKHLAHRSHPRHWLGRRWHRITARRVIDLNVVGERRIEALPLHGPLDE